MTSNDKYSSLRGPTRRLFLGGMAASLATPLAAPAIAQSSMSSFKIGVLLPFSGGLEMLAEQAMQGIQMVVQEANDAGGVLGRQIELVQADDKTDPRTAVERVTQLIRRDEVNAVIGPITSANRDAIKPTIERAQMPLLYATDYEGGVCSPWIACYSPLPAHFVEPLIPFLAKKKNITKYYLFGADYTWPRRMNAAIVAKTAAENAEIVGEEYTPFGVKDYASTIRKIRSSGAELVILTLPGADGVTFIKQMAASGLKNEVGIAYLGLNENYLTGFSNEEIEGIIGPVPFMQNLERPEAQDFVRRQRAMFGDDALVTYVADMHYNHVKFYLNAVKNADTDDREAVMQALPGQTLLSGNGEVYLRPEDLHVDLNVLVASVKSGEMIMEDYVGRVVAPSQCQI